MKHTLLALSVVVILVAAGVTAADKATDSADFKVDNSHSTLGFKVKHLGLSNVHGEFKEYDVTVKADPSTGKVTKVTATIKAKSLTTGIDKRDDHLRGADFFDTDKFPDVKFDSRNVKWTGNTVSIVGPLTMKGKTKMITFKGDYVGSQKVNFGSGDQMRAAYELSAKINRKDFGLNFAKVVEGVSVVGDIVTIDLDIQIMRELK